MKRTVGFFKSFKNQNQLRLNQPAFLEAKSYTTDFGSEKRLYCVEKEKFFKIEPYASLANLHTYSEASNACAAKLITRPITFNKSKIEKKVKC